MPLLFYNLILQNYKIKLSLLPIFMATKVKVIQKPNHWHFGQTPSNAIEVSLTL